MTQHTPTPWAVGPIDPRDIVQFGEGDPPDDPWYIAVTTKDAPNSKSGSENAKFIVTAVNSHEGLLEALEWALPLAQDGCKEPVDFEYLEKACAAIKSARVQQ